MTKRMKQKRESVSLQAGEVATRNLSPLFDINLLPFAVSWQ